MNLIQTARTYDYTTIKTNALRFGDAQIYEELVDVGEYLLVGDGVDDADRKEGGELGFRKGRWRFLGVRFMHRRQGFFVITRQEACRLVYGVEVGAVVDAISGTCLGYRARH